MATIIRGGFKDNKERIVKIEIWSPLGMGTYDLNDESSPVKIAFDSVEIEYDMDDLFQTIIKKTMKIDFVTTTYIGDVLFSDKVKEVKVTVKLQDVIIFNGYVEPYTFSQEYAHKQDEFTLNCIDELGCLEYQYMIQHHEWKNVISKEQAISFKEYLSMILPTNTYYDMSKKNGNRSVFDAVGVSMQVFLGDSEDDLENNEDNLSKILKYFNLHIIQNGSDLFIFDWNTIKAKGSKVFYNIFDNTTKTVDLSQITVTKDSYVDDSTSLSISDTYNQIKLKVNLDTIDTLLTDPLDTDDIQYYSNYKQLWFSEYISSGEGESAHNAFKSIIKQGYENGNTIIDDYDAWQRNDWYFKLGYNPKWKLMWNGIDVNDWIERDSQGNPINLHRIFEVMKSYRFFPFIIACGKNEDSLDRNNKSRLTSDGGVKGSIASENYIVISVNGNEDDSQAELKRIQSAIDKSSGYNETTDTAKGLLEYTGSTSGQYSPTDDDTTNYVVFKGSITLNPCRYISGWFSLGSSQWSSKFKASQPNITFKEVYDANVKDSAWAYTVDVTDNDDGGLYAHQFWKATTPGSTETQAPSTNMLYPFTDEKKARSLEYNYSGHWDSTDQWDKLDILECELKIGEKYLVETYDNGNKQKPKYGWYTESSLPYVNGKKKNTFSLGFDPEIGEMIIGKEYDITNTVNGKISDEKGMAVPIKKSDALSGKLSFKILGVVNQQWNEITRRHPTLFRSTKYYDNWKNLWSHVSSIWLKDFEIGIISDNKGSDVPSTKKDLLYVSNMVHDVIRTKDDEEFDICTTPTTEELIANGVETNIANNTAIDLNTNQPLESITDTTQSLTERPERLWVDQYWNIYSSPRCIVETKLDDAFLKGMNIYNMSTFGNTIPKKIVRNLRNCDIEVSLQQI